MVVGVPNWVCEWESKNHKNWKQKTLNSTLPIVLKKTQCAYREALPYYAQTIDIESRYSSSLSITVLQEIVHIIPRKYLMLSRCPHLSTQRQDMPQSLGLWRR